MTTEYETKIPTARGAVGPSPCASRRQHGAFPPGAPRVSSGGRPLGRDRREAAPKPPKSLKIQAVGPKGPPPAQGIETSCLTTKRALSVSRATDSMVTSGLSVRPSAVTTRVCSAEAFAAKCSIR